ncbi:cyclic nucleotide-binding domain-containing protein [Pendulispora albinea]|uniref:Cyclic nucleotide-binding domain-containing protein n=1 Tax=Pendulispora albinea TaxID=2741071 RepID=A0ABZ2M8W7_9BACT
MRFVDPIDRFLFLRKVPLLGTLPQERLATFSEHMTEVFFPAGTVFQHDGETIEHLRIIVEGEAEGFVATGETWKLPRHAVLGAFEFFAGASRQSVRTTRDTVMLEIPTGVLHGILEDDFDVVVHIFRGLTRVLLNFIHSYPFDELLQDLASPPNPPQLPTDPDPVEQMLILRQVIIFTQASIDGLAALGRTTTLVRIPAGADLWKAGDEASWGGVIISGAVTSTRIRPGGDALHFHLGRLAPLGLIEILAQRPRWFDACAAEDLVLLRIDLDDLYDTLEDHFDMTMACLASLANGALTVFERVGRARMEQVRGDAPRSISLEDDYSEGPPPS